MLFTFIYDLVEPVPVGASPTGGEAKAYFSTEFPKAQMSVEKLASMVVELQKKVVAKKK